MLRQFDARTNQRADQLSSETLNLINSSMPCFDTTFIYFIISSRATFALQLCTNSVTATASSKSNPYSTSSSLLPERYFLITTSSLFLNYTQYLPSRISCAPAHFNGYIQFIAPHHQSPLLSTNNPQISRNHRPYNVHCSRLSPVMF